VVIGHNDAVFIQNPSGTGPLLGERAVKEIERNHLCGDGDNRWLYPGDDISDVGQWQGGVS